MLNDKQRAAGWIEHNGGLTPPKDWDGGVVLFSTGTIGMPVGWMWAPFNDIHVIAYRPAP